MELGLDPALFWTLTPRLVSTIAKAARQRLDNEHNARAWHAHTTVALGRQKRLQRLDTLTVKRRRARPQTWQEQRTICRAIAAYYGSKPRHG